MFDGLKRALGRRMARALARPRRRYERFVLGEEDKLQAALRPGDVLLVEGDSRVASVIKYMTQSTWSHSALCVGDAVDGRAGAGARTLVEADLEKGVIAVPVSKYAYLNTRICRPVGLSEGELRKVIEAVVSQLGHTYDLKHVFDLLRYFLPVPPLQPERRRGLLAFGSGDPTRAICSGLIAQAFQAVRYPILPRYVRAEGGVEAGDEETWLRMRHYSHVTPRDFDVSPYFAVVKPTLESGFDHHTLLWQDSVSEGRGFD